MSQHIDINLLVQNLQDLNTISQKVIDVYQDKTKMLQTSLHFCGQCQQTLAQYQNNKSSAKL